MVAVWSDAALERAAARVGSTRQLRGGAGADDRPSGVFPMKIVSPCREQARRVYDGVVFEIQEEIPAWLLHAPPI